MERSRLKSYSPLSLSPPLSLSLSIYLSFEGMLVTLEIVYIDSARKCARPIVARKFRTPDSSRQLCAPYEIRYKLIARRIQKCKGLRMTGNKVKVRGETARPCSKVSLCVCRRGKKYFRGTSERDFARTIAPKPSSRSTFLRFFAILCLSLSLSLFAKRFSISNIDANTLFKMLRRTNT